MVDHWYVICFRICRSPVQTSKKTRYLLIRNDAGSLRYKIWIQIQDSKWLDMEIWAYLHINQSSINNLSMCVILTKTRPEKMVKKSPTDGTTFHKNKGPRLMFRLSGLVVPDNNPSGSCNKPILGQYKYSPSKTNWYTSYFKCFILLLELYWSYSYNYEAYDTYWLVFNWMLHKNWGECGWWLCTFVAIARWLQSMVARLGWSSLFPTVLT